MTQAQGLAALAAAPVKQGEEEAVPQPGAGIEDRLRLGDGEDPRQLLRRLQRDHPAAIRLPLADVVQERLPARPAARSPRGQQVAHPGTVAGLMGIERADGRELAVHRRDADFGRHGRQYRDLAGPARRGKLQPGDELPDVLQPGLAPVQAAEADEGPVILKIVSVGLHRVRRPADVSEIGQEPVHRDDRHVIIPQDRPRSRPRTGDHHRMQEHRLLLEQRHGQGSRWVLAAWGSRETWGCGAAAGGHGPAFVGARCAVGAPDGAVTGSGWPVPGVMSSREQPGSGGPREPVAGVSGRRHDRGVLPVTPYLHGASCPEGSLALGAIMRAGVLSLRARRSDSAFSRAAPRAAWFLLAYQGKRGGDGRGEDEGHRRDWQRGGRSCRRGRRGRW